MIRDFALCFLPLAFIFFGIPVCLSIRDRIAWRQRKNRGIKTTIHVYQIDEDMMEEVARASL